ncbi:MAG: thiamine phosphate synthase [Myxococcota bacterium]|jgi:thiamine-phosphate pyrophosphorylase
MASTAGLIRGFYGIVNVTEGGPDPVHAAVAMLRGGCRCIQLRAKNVDPALRLRLALFLRVMTRTGGVLLIIDDDAGTALEADADGVQVGQDDLSCKEARRVVGPDRLVGVSTHNIYQLEKAMADGADYAGFGPVFSTGTKENPDPVTGLDGLAGAVALTSIPLVAIGGITTGNAREVVGTGVHAFASIGAVYSAPDMAAAVSGFSELFGKTGEM